jgi:glycerol-3-phosphate dehydrogenase
MPRHTYLSRSKALDKVPGLRADALVGAMQYGDGQADDARHTMMVARTAVDHGAVVRTSTQVVRLLRETDVAGVERVVGAELRDTETGATCRVHSRVVINCTGVWTDDIQGMVSDHVPFRVRASKGIHITVPRERIASDTGLILRTEKSVLFVIPWKDLWLIGTTDTDWHLDLAHPAASSSDIDYVLDHVNAVLASPLTREDIVSVYAGLRPLLAGESDQTSKLSREHAVSRIAPGLVSIAGGKYTTYRVMAKDAIDAALPDLPDSIGDCVTQDRPIIGADGYRELVEHLAPEAQRWGIQPDRMQRLLERYGSLVNEVLAPIASDPRLAQPVHAAPSYLNAEIVYAVTHEGALHLDDILARRTRIAMETRHRGTESAADVARLVAPILGWDAVRVASEVSAYVARVEFERASQEQPGDAEAEAVRLLAPDTRHPMPVGNARA